MKPLAVGDRVAAYFCAGGKRKGIITGIDGDILICHDMKLVRFQAHVKQCRRLKKKVKPAAREWWIAFYNGNEPIVFSNELDFHSEKRLVKNYAGGCKVREVLP
jgi:hypothetical protein